MQLGGMFQGIVWPAIAGNVSWAFISVFVRDGISDNETKIRLAVLFVLAGYLLSQWLHTEANKANLPTKYWLADAPLTVAIATFAIMTDTKNSGALLTLGLIFGSGILGHIFGAWTPTNALTSWRRRTYMTIAHAIGVGFLIAGYCNGSYGFSMWMLMATIAVIALWAVSNIPYVSTGLDKA